MNASLNWKDAQYAAIPKDRLAQALADAGSDVLRGLFRPDYGLPAHIISDYLAGNDVDGVDAGSIIWEKLSKHINDKKLPILRDLAGRVLRSDEFPKSGNELTDDCAIPIVERLRQRLLENPSGGGIAQCFEHHIHYGLGTSEKLTEGQLRYLASVCALANRRPYSTIWLSRFVLEHLEKPQDIRNLLTIIDQYRMSYLRSIRDVFAANFERLYAPRRRTWFSQRPLHLLLVGYSHSVIEAVWGLAASSPVPIAVSIADIERAERWPRPTGVLRGVLDQNSKIQIINEKVPLTRKAIASKGVDYVVAGAKAFYLCGAGKNISFVVSAPCAEAIEAAKGKQVIIASGLFKVWAAALCKIYKQHVDAPALIGQDNRILRQEQVAMIGCERGVFDVGDFMGQELHRALFSAEDIEMFYALLVAKQDSENYKNLLNIALSEEKNANLLRKMTNLGTPSEEAPSSELFALLTKYTDDATSQISQFSSSKASLRKLVDENNEWYEAHKGRYIAIIGDKENEQYISSSFWDALRTGYERWPNRMFYVGKVTRPLPPDKVILR